MPHVCPWFASANSGKYKMQIYKKIFNYTLVFQKNFSTTLPLHPNAPFLVVFAAFEKEGEEDLVEALGDVHRDIVDAILHRTLAERREELLHLAAVGIGNFVGLQAQLAPAFEVDE